MKNKKKVGRQHQARFQASQEHTKHLRGTEN